MPADFAHLHVHSEYSLLDGMIRLPDLCRRCADLGMPAVAVTDHGNLHAAAYFQIAAKEAGIRPVLGCEVYVTPDIGIRDSKDRHLNHLVLLAESDEGWHNLVKLVSRSNTEGFYYKPRVDRGMIREYAAGLIALSACVAGEIPEAMLRGDVDSARETAAAYAEMFPGRFYLEIQPNSLPGQAIANSGVIALSAELGIPLVATCDSHYLNKEDFEAHEALLCINTGAKLSDADRLSFEVNDFYVWTPDEMSAAFPDHPEALANAAEIADRCVAAIGMGNHYFPVCSLPEGRTEEAEFADAAHEGLARRLAETPGADGKAYAARLEHEIAVITEMGFCGYFLVVQEFIRWAREHGIPVGPGRGSAAGSLAAYCLGITNIDPIPYGLLFERFLNPERVTLPDIDVDFAQAGRGEVIQHMRDAYGADHVAQITAIGTMGARGALRDAARVLGVAPPEADRLSKMIPDKPGTSLSESVSGDPALAAEAEKHRELFGLAMALEGYARNASVHASGLVVGDRPLDERVPLASREKVVVTAWDGPMVEAAGLVKFDFLGLKNLDVIDKCLKNIAKNGGESPDLDRIPLDDEATYALYTSGETDGVFQMESEGMRKYLRMLKPTRFEDIIAMCALYRPGPLGSGMVESFIRRKHGEEEIEYFGLDEQLGPILESTYGVIVYQEQVMRIAQALAGYTLGAADLLRRAMGKKKPEEMAKQRSVFIEGCAKNGIGEAKAEEIFGLMEKFAAYGFNKSHSAAYALVSYQTAYLKTHYPAEYMAAVMAHDSQDDLAGHIAAAERLGVPAAAPSVGESGAEFEARGGRIVCGLGGIKNVGAACAAIVEARRDAPFRSMMDLVLRVPRVNKRVLEALIKAGALDLFGVPRARMLAAAEGVVAARAKARTRKGAAGLPFADGGIGLDGPWDGVEEAPMDQLFLWEAEVMGRYVSGDPLAPYASEAARQGCVTIAEFAEGSAYTARVIALVERVRPHKAKSGRQMAFLRVRDATGEADVTVFADELAAYGRLLKAGAAAPLVLEVKANNYGESRDGAARMVLREAMAVDEACASRLAPVRIDVPEGKAGESTIAAIKGILGEFPGGCGVELHARIGGKNMMRRIGVRVAPCAEMYGRLYRLFKSA